MHFLHKQRELGCRESFSRGGHGWQGAASTTSPTGRGCRVISVARRAFWKLLFSKDGAENAELQASHYILLAPACPSFSLADLPGSALHGRASLKGTCRLPGAFWGYWPCRRSQAPWEVPGRTTTLSSIACPLAQLCLVPKKQKGGLFSLRLTWHLGVTTDFCKRSEKERNEVAVRTPSCPSPSSPDP